VSPLRLNFSSRARQLSGGDAIVVSIPKSGRTWVRTFFCAYFCERFGHKFTLEPSQYRDGRIPRIIYSHDLFEQRTKADLWDRVRGKYLIPARAIRRAHIILLARDPRDAFVSHYVQLVRRSADTPNELREKSVSELLRHGAFGIHPIIETMNQWLREFSGRANFTLVRYESLRAEPAKIFRDLLAALGDVSPEEKAFGQALRFSEFENMKKMEAAGAFDSKILKPGDVSDPESFKVRRGKIGGFREYLSPEDQRYAAAAMNDLDPRLDYNP
jgi:sulfotransferase family protein